MNQSLLARSSRVFVVDIEKVGYFGEGIGTNSDNEVVFVPFVAVGETCEVQEVSRRRHFVYARKLRTLNPGKHSVEPLCPVFGVCGGCQLQHMDYEIQVEQKTQILQHIVKKHSSKTVTVESFGCPSSYGYRRRMRFRQREGRLGFFQRATLTFVPVNRCPIAVSSINAWISDPGVYPRPDTLSDVSVDAMSDGTIQVFEGSEQQSMGFRQANAWGEDMLQTLVAQSCQNVQKGILELFSGAGSLVLSWFGPKGEQVYWGVDGDRAGIERGIATYGSSGIHFDVGRLPDWLRKKQKKTPRFLDQFDILVLDPPRGGVAKGLWRVPGLDQISQVIYISCDPLSWGKDIRRISSDLGFELVRVAMVDMFPQTRHFEVFSVLTRKPEKTENMTQNASSK